MPDIERAMPQDNAGMVKLVYTTDSKSVAFGRGGSSPPTGTKHRKVAFIATFVVLGVCEFLTQHVGLDASPVKSPTGTIFK